MDAQSPVELSSKQAEARPAQFQPSSEIATASTGPLHACAIQELLAEEWQRARGSRGPLAVILLRSLSRGQRGQSQHAAAVLAELQPNARVGAYDRNALLVVSPQTRADAATQLARTLAVRLSGHGKIACGVAAHPEMAASPAELVSAAERAARRANINEPVVLAPAVPFVFEPRAAIATPSAGALADLMPSWRAASADAAAVLLLGEAGAGKQSVAQALHSGSTRANGPFKVVHCAAIPEDAIAGVLFGTDRPGALAEAAGGTLFLDDVAALSLAAQAALVQALQTRTLPAADGGTRPLAVQIIAATHHDLAALVAQGAFRDDLLQLLSAVRLELPALRNRTEEILSLAQHFVNAISAQWGATPPRITDESRSLLADYAWPGNVSELRHVMERAVALAEDDSITPAEFPEHVRNAVAGAAAEEERVTLPRGFLDLRASLLDHEAMLIRQALQLTRGNQRKAASLLKLPLRTLERKLRNLGGRHRLMAS